MVLTYILPPPVAPQQPAQPPQAAPTPPPQQPSAAPQQPAQPKAPAPAPGYLGATHLILLAAVAAVVAAAVAAYLVIRRRPGSVLEEFSEVDAEIIRALRQAGGGMFQSELASALGLPTTTVWRHIRKLGSAGVVVVEKRMGRNYVRLVKPA